MAQPLTQALVKSVLDYDPETGVFVRKDGRVAGGVSKKGYRYIHLGRALRLAQVLAWVVMTGELPPRNITMRNGIKDDTRWTNLRLSGAESELTAERLREILDYDSMTGIFTYRRSRGPKQKAGAVAGRISPKSMDNGGGYRLISIDHVEYGAHRLAWFYVHGEWPALHVDHKNQNRDSNWIDNLREATRSQNMANQGLTKRNTSGFKGVSFHKASGKWIANIKANGKAIYLGLFVTAQEASAAYRTAALEFFGEFAAFERGLVGQNQALDACEAARVIGNPFPARSENPRYGFVHT